MTDQSRTAAPVSPLSGGGSSSLADGKWHRLHPLTPLFRGGLVLVVVIGIVLANLRERVVYWAISIFGGDVDIDIEDGDPVGWAIDWTVGNNLILVAGLALLAALLIVCGAFWLVWRKHEFRITEEHVEVRRGILFRTHRRAPLDRVQGVNLTRPFIARLVGIAKLEVDGAGTDANVPLEYLATKRAEEVRADILRLASGVRTRRAEARAGGGSDEAHGVTATVSQGVQGLIDGVDTDDVAPESLVRIPTGRILGSQALDLVTWAIILAVAYGLFIGVLLPIAITNDDGPEEGFAILGITAVATLVPIVIALVAVLWSKVSKSLRYAIAETPGGVRITHGLLTTTTQTIPPGRIHALEITQPILWRPFGWWHIRINRVSGRSAAQQQSGAAQQSAQILPVGTRADIERVLAVCLPYLPLEDLPLVVDHGMYGPVADEPDPYRTMARRGWWRRPVSFRRHGYAVSAYGLMMRRGVVWRKQAIFPLARLQGVSLAQGPIDRAQRVAWAHAHVVQGMISGQVVGLDRADALELLEQTSAGAVAAAAADQTHRWGESAPAPGTLAEAIRSSTGVLPGAAGVPQGGDLPLPPRGEE
ncbi:MAG: PH domain-containing protein [Microbacterium sp.]